MIDLNDRKAIESIDKSNLRQVIIDFPDQFAVGLKIAKNIKLKGKFNSVTVSGMGGSALPIDLFRIYSNNLLKSYSNYEHVEIYVNRYYSLPPESYHQGALNLISSYSGNTEETISSLEEAHTSGMPFIGLSSGGRIEELCSSYDAPHVRLPIPNPSFQPRMGTGYFFGAILQLLINHDMLPDVSAELISLSERLKANIEKHEEDGKNLAKKLMGKTPVIYSSPKYKTVAMVWKIKINENSKTPAFWNFFPELNHNEMVGFTNPQGKFFLVMLRDPLDNHQNRKRYEATASLLLVKGIESEILEMQGESVFEKIFSSIALADWTSYYLALLYDQDPTPVDLVEQFKKIIA